MQALTTNFDDRFLLLEHLGSGGYGQVYKVYQSELKREAALKVLNSSSFFREEDLQRFFREARVLSRLESKHIVSAYQLGVSRSGQHYILMEYVEGASLRKALKESGGFEPARALRLARQACSALKLVHAKGILHRDLKPENLLLSSEGGSELLKLIDFGLAACPSAEKLTASGVLLGSVRYMSPEQCGSEDLDQRADLYALAVVLFEMLSGQLPYDDDNPLAIMQKHRREPVPRLRTKTRVSSLLDSKLQIFFQKALAKNPEDRFGDVFEFDAALEDLQDYLDVIDLQSGRILKLSASLVMLPLIASLALAFTGFQLSSNKASEGKVSKDAFQAKQESSSFLDRWNSLQSCIKAEKDSARKLGLARQLQDLAGESFSHKRRYKMQAAVLMSQVLQEQGLYESYLAQNQWAKDAKLSDCLSLEISTCQLLDQKIGLAIAHFELGHKESAKEQVAELTAASSCLGIDGGARLLGLCIKMTDLCSARELIANTTNKKSLLRYAAICREQRVFELCSLSLECIKARVNCDAEHLQLIDIDVNGAAFCNASARELNKDRLLLELEHEENKLYLAMKNCRS